MPPSSLADGARASNRTFAYLGVILIGANLRAPITSLGLVLPDIQAEQLRNRNTVWSRQMRFEMICEANDIEHLLTKPNHP